MMYYYDYYDYYDCSDSYDDDGGDDDDDDDDSYFYYNDCYYCNYLYDYAHDHSSIVV